MKTLLAAIVVAATLVPAGARAASPGDTLQYYVGTWACVGGPLVNPPVHATTTYTYGDGILRERLTIPKQGKMKGGISDSAATVYDAQKKRYVQTILDSEANWGVSTAQPWSGTTETWFDQTNSDGKPGRTVVAHLNHDAFVVTGYPAPSSSKAIFKASCKRAS